MVLVLVVLLVVVLVALDDSLIRRFGREEMRGRFERMETAVSAVPYGKRTGRTIWKQDNLEE